MKSKFLMILCLVMLVAPNTQGQNPIENLKQRAAQYEPIILAATARYKVDAHLLWTIAYLESRFTPEAISYKNDQPCAFGMMQFQQGTAGRYGLVNPYNPVEAIDAAARYVRDLTIRFNGRVDLILAAYNAGEGAVEAFREGRKLQLNGKIINPGRIRTDGIPPYAETQKYVAQGLLMYRSLTRQQQPLSSSVPAKNPQSSGLIPSSLYVSEHNSGSHSQGNQTKASLSIYVN